jgi:hypothetical protein
VVQTPPVSAIAASRAVRPLAMRNTEAIVSSSLMLSPASVTVSMMSVKAPSAVSERAPASQSLFAAARSKR